MGVRVPKGRTPKQRPTAFCRNPECREMRDGAMQEFHFPVEHDNFSCPKCGADRSPMVGLLTLTHFLLRDAAGQIRGTGGLRYSLACDTNRDYLATLTNNEAATGDIDIVNCPGCLAAAERLGIKQNQGWVLDLEG